MATFLGTNRRDFLVGSTGNDTLSGLADDDWITGRGGNDILVGGAGNDIMSGGEGADVFRFNPPHTTVETFTFTPIPNNGSLDLPTFHLHQYWPWLDSLPDPDRDGVTWFKDDSFEIHPNPAVVTLVLDPDPDTDPSDGITTLTAAATPTGYVVFLNSLVPIHTVYAIGQVTATTVFGGETGRDVITDFKWGQDTLDLGDLGLTEAQFAQQFKVTEVDLDRDGKLDTKFGLVDGSWSVTLLGVSGHPVGDFYGFA